MVDALALRGDEGRYMATISSGEVPSAVNPEMSEWGNPITSSDDLYLSKGANVGK